MACRNFALINGADYRAPCLPAMLSPRVLDNLNFQHISIPLVLYCKLSLRAVRQESSTRVPSSLFLTKQEAHDSGDVGGTHTARRAKNWPRYLGRNTCKFHFLFSFPLHTPCSREAKPRLMMKACRRRAP